MTDPTNDDVAFMQTMRRQRCGKCPFHVFCESEMWPSEVHRPGCDLTIIAIHGVLVRCTASTTEYRRTLTSDTSPNFLDGKEIYEGIVVKDISPR